METLVLQHRNCASELESGVARQKITKAFFSDKAEEAIRYFCLATTDSNSDAHVELGLCYSYGNGVDVDEDQAVNYFSYAADNKNSNGQQQLGLCFKLRCSVEKDPKRNCIRSP